VAVDGEDDGEAHGASAAATASREHEYLAAHAEPCASATNVRFTALSISSTHMNHDDVAPEQHAGDAEREEQAEIARPG